MEVVPAELLADTVDRRHVDRDLRALQLDGFLRRLARQEAVCRRVLGRLARTFLAGRYHHRLGFARLGDWTRERLGLSARQVQDLARVAERLESLPAIAAAFAAGDLSWTRRAFSPRRPPPTASASGWRSRATRRCVRWKRRPRTPTSATVSASRSTAPAACAPAGARRSSSPVAWRAASSRSRRPPRSLPPRGSPPRRLPSTIARPT